MKKKEEGTVRIELSEEAENFLLAPEKYLGLIGGFGSGKTHLLCELAIKCAIDNAGAPGMMVAPTYKMIRDPLLNLFEEILDEKEIDYKLLKSPDIIITLFNRSNYHNHITFRSADRPKSLRGPSLSFFGIDEAAMVDGDSWNDCVSRLRHKRSKYFKGFIGTTPEGIDDWIYDEFVEKCEDDKRKGLYNRFHIDSRDNPSNPQEYIDALFDTYDENTQDAYIRGLFIDMKHGRVYHAYGNHNIAEVEFDPYLNLGLTCDFNVHPMVWEIFQYKRNYIEFLDEILIPDNAKTEFAMNLFCDWYDERRNEKVDCPRKQVNIFGDATGGHRSTVGESDYLIMKEVLIRRGVPYVGHIPTEGNPPIKDRLNSVNSALKDRGDATKVKIDPKCKRLIKDFKLIIFNKRGEIDKRREERGGLTHASEAAGYAIYALMPIERIRQRQQIISWDW